MEAGGSKRKADEAPYIRPQSTPAECCEWLSAHPELCASLGDYLDSVLAIIVRHSPGPF